MDSILIALISINSSLLILVVSKILQIEKRLGRVEGMIQAILKLRRVEVVNNEGNKM